MLSLFIQIYGLLLFALIANWVHKAWAGKISRGNISLMFLTFSGVGIWLARIGFLEKNTELFSLRISGIFYLTGAFILLIAAIEVKITSYELFEEAKIWMKWCVSFLVITYLNVLLMEYPHTKVQFNRLVLGIVGTVCALFLPSWINSKRSEDTE